MQGEIRVERAFLFGGAMVLLRAFSDGVYGIRRKALSQFQSFMPWRGIANRAWATLKNGACARRENPWPGRPWALFDFFLGAIHGQTSAS